MSVRILIIDDDRRLGEMLVSYFEGVGIRADHQLDGASGILAVQRGDYDGVVLDVMLPDLDGFEVCKRLRAGSNIPILMLTARGEETDRIVGLELGADDYLPKPFNPRELLARLRAILRRSGNSGDEPSADREVLVFGELVIDRRSRTVTLEGKVAELTGHQFELLWTLAERPGRVLSREQLMELTRGEELEAFDRSIDVHVSRIRAALETDPKKPLWIKTVRGAGYVFTGGEE